MGKINNSKRPLSMSRKEGKIHNAQEEKMTAERSSVTLGPMRDGSVYGFRRR